MRAAGITGVSRRRSTPVTTRQATDHHPASDLVRRNFTAERPNELWVADITSLPTLAGFLYLAVVLDAWSRRIVGWAFSAELKTRVDCGATRKKGRPKPLCRPTRTERSRRGSRRAFVAAIRRRRRAEGLGFRGPAPYPVPVVSTMAWCIYDVNRAPHSKEATEKGARKPPSRLLDRPAYALGSCLPYRGVPWSWARR
jgi:hypothetical protein